MTDYRIDDQIHDGDWYDRINVFDHDVAFYRDLAVSCGGPVLELCAGTGRLTLPLREASVDVTGLDISPLMLTTARRKAAERGLDVEFIEADMRDFACDRRFALILVPFNSLQCLYTNEDVARVLTNIRRHLAPGGRFAFDIFNPDPRFFVERREGWTETQRFHLDDGRECVLSEQCAYEQATQINRETWRYVVGEDERRAQLDVRCFYPLEMDLVLAHTGFAVVTKHGDFSGAAVVGASLRMGYVCAAVD